MILIWIRFYIARFVLFYCVCIFLCFTTTSGCLLIHPLLQVRLHLRCPVCLPRGKSLPQQGAVATRFFILNGPYFNQLGFALPPLLPKQGRKKENISPALFEHRFFFRRSVDWHQEYWFFYSEARSSQYYKNSLNYITAEPVRPKCKHFKMSLTYNETTGISLEKAIVDKEKSSKHSTFVLIENPICAKVAGLFKLQKPEVPAQTHEVSLKTEPFKTKI